MELISAILGLAIFGLIVYLILQLPMPDVVKTGIQILAIIFVILYVCQALGIPLPFPR